MLHALHGPPPRADGAGCRLMLGSCVTGTANPGSRRLVHTTICNHAAHYYPTHATINEK